jgi:DNA polymerase III epsilon subunit-like protein
MQMHDTPRRIFWDLETTGFLPLARIVSIGWSCDGCATEVLVLPVIAIEVSASKVHGWTMDKLSAHGAVDISTALHRFVQAIAYDPTPVVLCAHNGKSFDTHVLRAELERVRCSLPENVIGFADTMLWCRKSKMKECSLDALAMKYLGKEARDTHSAAVDAQLLESVVCSIEATSPSMPPLLALVEDTTAFDARTSKAAIRGTVDWMVDCVSTD